jgi:hypothetical protein
LYHVPLCTQQRSTSILSAAFAASGCDITCLYVLLFIGRFRTLAEEFGSYDSSINSSRGSCSRSRSQQLIAALSEEGTAANANLYLLLRACDK